MIYRRAVPRDYDSIVRLQAANYIANLPPERRKDGFLSAEFTREQIAEMAEDLGILVAVDSGSLAGYLCAFRNEFNHGSPVLAKMLECYETVGFEGRPLGAYSSYIYGPVCIDRNHRQRGLLRGLYEEQKKDLAGRFELGVAFVSRNNPHSLQTHIAGLGMTEVGEFEFKDHVYAILAFRLPVKLDA
jgi:predicted GNAT superfamily acetyltransferase